MPNSFRLRAAALSAATAVAMSALLAGCSDDSGSDSGGDEDPTAQNLGWKDCPAPSEAEGGGAAPSPLPDGAEWQCATMKAPLDWDDPEGDTIDLALIRAEASGEADRRIGSLVFNFGGPGGSGVTTLPAFGQDYAALRTRYDLVSFDPRGVGRSAPVECLDDKQLDAYFQQDATPTTRPSAPSCWTTPGTSTRPARRTRRRSCRTCAPPTRPATWTSCARSSATTSCTISASPTAPNSAASTPTCSPRRWVAPSSTRSSTRREPGTGLARAGEGLPARTRQLRRGLRVEGRGLPGRHQRAGRQGPYRPAAEGPRPQTDPRHASLVNSPRPPRPEASRKRCTRRTSGST